MAATWFTTWRDRATLRWQRGRAAVAISPRTAALLTRDRVMIGAFVGWVTADGVGWPIALGPALGALAGLPLGAWRFSAPASPGFSAPGWWHLPPHRYGRVTLRPLERRDAGPAAATIDDEVVGWNGWTEAEVRYATVVLSHPLVAQEVGTWRSATTTG